MTVKEINLSEMLFNRDNKLLDYITNLQQENDGLKNRLENAVADCILRLQENERLNNIINELEKYLEEQSTNLNRMSCTGHAYFMYQEDENILNKLKELKESVK